MRLLALGVGMAFVFAACASGTKETADAGPDMCASNMELCNDVDDNCNGTIDEGFDLTTDPDHCGTCTTACTSSTPGEEAVCEAGVCTEGSVECFEGWADCNDSDADGCETSLTTATDCGECGRPCTIPNADTACSAGQCELARCHNLFGDCDNDVTNGCETDLHLGANCGACDVQCSGMTGACATQDGVTQCVSQCAGGTPDMCGASCVDTQLDPRHCGACFVTCHADHATPGCMDGMCTVDHCGPGYQDCNNDPSDGCESPSDADPANCGTCGTVCPPSQARCLLGQCAACADGMIDCNSEGADGCEVNSLTDPSHCGDCATDCGAPANATAGCTDAMCNLTCNSGFANCDGDPSNGCEIDTQVDVNHCGGCGAVCPVPPHTTPTCAGSTCGFTCNPAYTDCNGDPSDGCEILASSTCQIGGACVPDGGTNPANTCQACIVGRSTTAWSVLPTGAACTSSGTAGSCRGGGTPTCCTGCWDGSVCRAGTISSECGAAGAACASCADSLSCTVDACDGATHTCTNTLPTGCVINNTCVAEGTIDPTSVCRRCIGSVSRTGYSEGSQGDICTVGGVTGGCWGTPASCCTAGCYSSAAGCTTASTTVNQCGSSGFACEACACASDTCVGGACQSTQAAGVFRVSTSDHTCATNGAGLMDCWGNNSSGQLGLGYSSTPVLTPTRVAMTGWNGVFSTGADHTCAINGGALWCWGSNATGQLGLGMVGGTYSTPQRVGAATDWTSVAAGLGSTCGMRGSTMVFCWGLNRHGQLGLGDTMDRSSPMLVTTGVSISGTATGEFYCATGSNYVLYCWGDNAYGQLGDGTTIERRTPTAISGPALTLFGASLGSAHACTVAYSSCGSFCNAWTIYCWGDNQYGQLGVGDRVARLTPAMVLQGQTYIGGLISVVTANGSCAISMIAGMPSTCWGRNTNGELMIGPVPDAVLPTRTRMDGLSMVVGGSTHLCGQIGTAYTTTYALHCWGYSATGATGSTSNVSGAAPLRACL